MPSRDSRVKLQPAIPDTDWYPSFMAAGIAASLPHGVAQNWLQQKGSLTRALQRRCHEHFQVKVYAEGFALPRPDEAKALGIPARHTAWVREVQLCGDDVPWVLARTIIPRTTLAGHGRRLCHLGQKPLGSYLFSRPEWQRGPIQPGRCHPQPDGGHHPVFARRSCFASHTGSLLVVEYFLPALLEQ